MPLHIQITSCNGGCWESGCSSCLSLTVSWTDQASSDLSPRTLPHRCGWWRRYPAHTSATQGKHTHTETHTDTHTHTHTHTHTTHHYKGIYLPPCSSMSIMWNMFWAYLSYIFICCSASWWRFNVCYQLHTWTWLRAWGYFSGGSCL